MNAIQFITGFTELRDQINKTSDLQEKELLLEQLEAMHRVADEESKLHEDTPISTFKCLK